MFSDIIEEKAAQAEQKVSGAFARAAAVAAANQRKVVAAMRGARVSDSHFAGSTGYGYHDSGRDALERVYAGVFKTESALVRQQIASGTHAIAICLYGNLRPGDELLSITGRPYDTILSAIGLRGAEGAGSLRELGVTYREVPLAPGGGIDLEAARKAVNARTKLVMIQRSRGYSWRDAVGVEEIGRAISVLKNTREGLIVFVDNCYGEFVEEQEPTELGADLIAGSLIKNPGGGLAPSGGYVAGSAAYVKNAAYRLTAPGLGGEIGATHAVNRLLFQGFFLAPHIVGECMKSAVFLASLMEAEGYKTSPSPCSYRSDIVQAVELGTVDRLLAFCRGIQSGSAIDSFVTPEPWLMPGYEHEVIMAAGTFIQGASVELSADAPMVAPYIVYVQGGLVYESAKIGFMSALQNLYDCGPA
ncbi:MAG: methionine gamma-lyase family protein [Oscillospiraceae bacterium]|nr:methionine gamma-lyase family protein [Oscillospiraceae bacterium]